MRVAFAGRAQERATLRALVPRSAGEGRRAAFVAGEPGSGKSRLVRELARDVADEGATVLYGDCDGVVGFISPVSEPYCGACNRMRLTADGKFHLCLLNDDELDVKQALRAGRGQAEVEEILLRAVAGKPTGHRLDEGLSTRSRAMFQIGG